MAKRASGNTARGSKKAGEQSASAADFARGQRQFNARKFWHAHESWEVIWLASAQPEKTFLQGLIQISAAFYHHQRKNLLGARSLLGRGLEKVEQFPDSHHGLRLEELRRAVRKWLADLQGGQTCAEERYPKLLPAARRSVVRKSK